MLAYVFWHWPSPGSGPDEYEKALDAFHAALYDRAATEGFAGSIVYRVERLPFEAPAAPAGGYEDWYLVEDWRALGRLNEAAISGAAAEPHDRAAAASGGGAGAIYALVRGAAALKDVTRAAWLSKPRGWTSELFLRSLELGPGARAWQRQMVLGPAPEFCVQSSAEVQLPGEPAGLDRRTAVSPYRSRS